MARKGATATKKPARRMTSRERDEKMKAMGGKAWLATRRLNMMLPMLERYAQVVSRNPNIRVRATHQSTYTDGTTIFIQPPMRLGDDTPHDVGRCGVRDDNRRLTCEACDVDEMVMGLVYHEIAHLVFGSYVQPQHGGRSVFMKLVKEWHPLNACDHAMDLIEKINNAKYYIEMANIFDERMGIALNAQEDTRVNERMFEARPGTRVMMDANLHDVFSRGAERADGTVMHWGDAPMDFQVSIGMLLMASGCQQYIDQLHPDAQDILHDEQLSQLAAGMTQCNSAHELVGLSADVWRRFQELGVMLKDKCVPPPAEDDEQDEGVSPDQEEPAAEEDAGDAPDIGSLGNEGQPSPSDGEGESGKDGSGDNGEGEGSDDGSGAGTDGEPDAAPGPSGDEASDSSGGDTGSDTDQSGMSGMQGSSEGAASSGGGDSVSDGDESGAAGQDHEDDGPRGQGDRGDDEGKPDVVDDGASGQVTDGGQEESEEVVADGDKAEQDVEAGGGEGENAERTDAESEGGASGSSGGADTGHDGEDAGEGGDSEGEEEESYVTPADYTTATAAEILEVLKAASIHSILGEEANDDFAVGESLLNQEPIDARDLELWAELIAVALSQSAYLAGPAEDVGKVDIIKYGDKTMCDFVPRRAYDWKDIAPPLQVIGPIVNAGRVAFSPNRKSGFQNNLKSGKINARSLATKIPAGKEDIFRHRRVEAKRSYHVIITVDVSGSTRSGSPTTEHPYQNTLQAEVRSVMAQAEALNALGISFEIWAHTAGYYLTEDEERAAEEARLKSDFTYPKINLWMIKVKAPEERWTDEIRTRLTALKPVAGNIDGHTLQFLRLRAEEMKRKFTDVPICYYTDGAMAASNADEEADVMRAETALCKRKGIPLLAVAIGTDSPKKWGFDTVVIETDEDLKQVMKQLERHLF